MSRGIDKDRASECLICGKLEMYHHDFTAPEKGCVCEPGGWDGATEVPMICRAFVPSRFDKGRCETCEHDQGCHAEPTT